MIISEKKASMKYTIRQAGTTSEKLSFNDFCTFRHSPTHRCFPLPLAFFPLEPCHIPLSHYTPLSSGASKGSQLGCSASSAAAITLHYCHTSACSLIHVIIFRFLHLFLTLNHSHALALWNLYKSYSSQSAHSLAYSLNFSSIHRTMTHPVSPMIEVLLPFKYRFLLLC